MKFVIIKSKVGTLESQQTHLREHLEYLESLRDRQVLINAGSFDDRSGGLLLVEAPGLEEAIALAREDPLVREGVETYEVHGWQPILAETPPGLEDDQLPLFHAADVAPLQAPPAEESFRIVEATSDSRYAEFLFTCFMSSGKGRKDPTRADYLRRAGRRGLRKLLLLHEEEIAGQLEFAPPAMSGLPIEGEKLAVVHCLWVIDAYTGLGGSRLLLASCAELSGAQGLATIAYNTSLPWLPRSFFERHGFLVVDQAETGRFFGNTPVVAYLLWRPLDPAAKPPTWNRAQLHEGFEFCPHYPWLAGKRLYWGKAFDYHGLVVKEGLRRPELLQQLPCLGHKRTENWTLVKFGLPAADLNRALDLIQAALLAEPTYYAHVYGNEKLFVVFPDRIFRLGSEPAGPGWAEARRYGLDKGIPDEELVFHPSRFDEETF